jgi:hypothetical protein
MITERAFDTGEIGTVHPGFFGDLLLGPPLALRISRGRTARACLSAKISGNAP